MKTLYEESELDFAIVWIVIYCFLQSLAKCRLLFTDKVFTIAC